MTLPSPDEIAKWDRWFAVEANNRTWTLTEKATLTDAEREEMLDSAHAAALHWGKVGTPLNKARADTLLGHVHALLGKDTALIYAQRSFDYVMSNESPDWEIAYGYAIMAHAHQAGKNEIEYERFLSLAKEFGAKIQNPNDKKLFDALLVKIQSGDQV